MCIYHYIPFSGSPGIMLTVLTRSIFYLPNPVPLQFVNISTKHVSLKNGTYFVKIPDHNTMVSVNLLPAFEETYVLLANPLKVYDDIFVLAEGKNKKLNYYFIFLSL